VNLNIRCFLPEIPLRFEAPVKKTGDPVLQTFDVNGDERVQVFPKRRDEFPVRFEAFDESFALARDVVYGLLNSHSVEFHENDDHVPSLSASLFDIVRYDVLLCASVQLRKKNGREAYI